MNLEVLYESASPCVVAFISKMLPLPAGQQPVFPEMFGTGFLVNDSGLVATNRHVVEAFDQLWRNCKTGEFAGAALMFLVEADKHGCQMLNIGVKSWGAIDSFSSATDWYSQPVPDIGFVQLEARETPFLELADGGSASSNREAHNGGAQASPRTKTPGLPAIQFGTKNSLSAASVWVYLRVRCSSPIYILLINNALRQQ